LLQFLGEFAPGLRWGDGASLLRSLWLGTHYKIPLSN